MQTMTLYNVHYQNMFYRQHKVVMTSILSLTFYGYASCKCLCRDKAFQINHSKLLEADNNVMSKLQKNLSLLDHCFIELRSWRGAFMDLMILHCNVRNKPCMAKLQCCGKLTKSNLQILGQAWYQSDWVGVSSSVCWELYMSG